MSTLYSAIDSPDQLTLRLQLAQQGILSMSVNVQARAAPSQVASEVIPKTPFKASQSQSQAIWPITDAILVSYPCNVGLHIFFPQKTKGVTIF